MIRICDRGHASVDAANWVCPWCLLDEARAALSKRIPPSFEGNPPELSVNMIRYGQMVVRRPLKMSDPTLCPDGTYGYSFDMSDLGFDALLHVIVRNRNA